MASFDITILFQLIYDFFAFLLSGNYAVGGGVIAEWFRAYLPVLQGLGFFITFAAIAGIVYVFLGINSIRQKEARELGAVPDGVGEGGAVQNERWQAVVEHVQSENPNDWRYAILEADIMLGDLLTELQYRGESIGEQLKQIEQSDFTTLEYAWEAHKVRNVIAHHGSDYVLTKREAKRVIELYEKVFQEFKIA